MNNYSPAKQSIKDSYDIDTLQDIVSHGCESGVAHDHIYYRDTIQFFNDFEEEIIEEVENTFGQEYLVEVFNNQGAAIDMYKNAICWTYVELIAHELIDEFESTTCEELSDLDDDISFDFSSQGDTLTAKPLNETTYEAVKELANTEWGQSHLQIVMP